MTKQIDETKDKLLSAILTSVTDVQKKVSYGVLNFLREFKMNCLRQFQIVNSKGLQCKWKLHLLNSSEELKMVS